jgi:plastocyanin
MGLKHVVGVASAIMLTLAGSTAAATQSRVEVRIFQFRPGHLEIKAGTKVTWTNQDDITHTVTSGTPETRDGRFGQRLEGRNTATTIEFKEPGIYPYFCERHLSMRGEIRVN